MPAPTALPALDDNYIWAMTGNSGHAVLVDPGEAAPVQAAIRAGLRPCAILLTHHHGDHIGAAAELADEYELPIYAPDDARIPRASVRVGEGDVVDLPRAGLRFSVMHLPGHTLTHLAYVGEGVAFTGDTLFSLGCGRLFEGSPAQMFDSLQRLAALPGDTLVCCAHEYTQSNAAFARVVDPDNPALEARVQEIRSARAADRPTLPVRLASERATNPFLRCDDAAIAPVWPPIAAAGPAMPWIPLPPCGAGKTDSLPHETPAHRLCGPGTGSLPVAAHPPCQPCRADGGYRL